MLYRKAVMADIPSIHRVVNEYASQGLMLRRPITMLYESVRDFTVAVDESGKVAGVGGLHIMWQDLAEIRSLAVRPDLSGKGIGRMIIERLIREAEGLGLKRVFALTYQQAFFEKCGFRVVLKESLPQKVWRECIYCDKFHQCDEIAVIRLLVSEEALLPDDSLEIPIVDRPTWVKE